MVHGHDIARALHRPWPVDPAHIELITQGVTPVLPGWLDSRRARDHTARYEVRLRGFGSTSASVSGRPFSRGASRRGAGDRGWR